jgi:hypothetical protein
MPLLRSRLAQGGLRRHLCPTLPYTPKKIQEEQSVNDVGEPRDGVVAASMPLLPCRDVQLGVSIPDEKRERPNRKGHQTPRPWSSRCRRVLSFAPDRGVLCSFAADRGVLCSFAPDRGAADGGVRGSRGPLLLRSRSRGSRCGSKRGGVFWRWPKKQL